ncbi:MAG: ATP-dependent DNA helicase RecG [Candidatus Dojkabacteria bacterium]
MIKLTELKGIGSKLEQAFTKLEIYSLENLLLTFPRAYADYSQMYSLADLSFEEKKATKARVVNVKNTRLRGGGRAKSIQSAVIEDKSTRLNVIWFNMPFIEDALLEGEEYIFIGKLSRNKKNSKKIQLISPIFEKNGEELLHAGRIVPIYGLTKGISPKVYRKAINQALQLSELIFKDVIEPEQNVLNRILKDPETPEKWLQFTQALKEAHFPSSFSNLEAATFRLGVQELIPIQRHLANQKRIRENASSIVDKVLLSEEKLNKFWSMLEFEPTRDQQHAARTILKDMQSKPMYRLLQGDVGSGKTAVAAAAVDQILGAGKDVILIAPTTVLAEQHFAKMQQWFGYELVELVTSQTEIGKYNQAASESESESESGGGNRNETSKLYVATQAILHRFENLQLDVGLLIIDEEQRLGVAQKDLINRKILLQSNSQKLPHYLSLTATPIPRTLALAIFGSQDVSQIVQKPPNQKAKQTILTPESKRADSYGWIKHQIEQGNQVFWICPLIENREDVAQEEAFMQKTPKQTVSEMAEKLEQAFPELQIAQLHGKMNEKKKIEVLESFRNGKFNILVSTTVIEVGIDIPNANIIVIESAQNFGLAQLHQLRGRVGRGGKQGYCLLFTGSDKANHRLKKFTEEDNGFKLAEYDLKTRGPGEVYGKNQSGLPNLRIADITNLAQLRTARLLAI